MGGGRQQELTLYTIMGQNFSSLEYGNCRDLKLTNKGKFPTFSSR